MNLPKSNLQGETGNRDQHQILTHLRQISILCLNEAEHIFDSSTIQSLRRNIESMDNNRNDAVDFFSCIIFALIEKIDESKHYGLQEENHEDYQVLEEVAQKAQAQIRKHISVEQQMKIYIDSLQEQLEQLTNKLIFQEKKYLVLFQNMKQIDKQRQTLAEKLIHLQQKNVISRSQSKYLSVHEKSRQEGPIFHKPILTKSNSIIDKIYKRAQKMSDKKMAENLNFREAETKKNTEQKIIIQQKKSVERSIKRSRNASHEPSVRELSRSIHMKVSEKKLNRRMPKYKTDLNNSINKNQRKNSAFQYY